MPKKPANMVYVVSLSNASEFGINFKDWVARRCYTYPVIGGAWPEPPTYIAFRYGKRLQSIHFVEAVERFTNPSKVLADADNVRVREHYCLTLGPGFAPKKPVATGNRIFQATRVWVMLDTLFTCDTISAALEETKLRHSRRGRRTVAKKAAVHSGPRRRAQADA